MANFSTPLPTFHFTIMKFSKSLSGFAIQNMRIWLLVFQLSMFPPEKTSFVTVICSDGFRNHLMKCEPMKPMKQQLTFKKKPKRVQQNGRRETRWPSPGLQKMAWGSYLNHLCHFWRFWKPISSPSESHKRNQQQNY